MLEKEKPLPDRSVSRTIAVDPAAATCKRRLSLYPSPVIEYPAGLLLYHKVKENAGGIFGATATRRHVGCGYAAIK